MKKTITLFLLFFIVITSVCAEKLSFHTGEAFGLSNTDYFFPTDITFTASKCTVTSIKKADVDLWCFTIVASKSANTNAPVCFEFFVREGDILMMRRLTNPMEKCSLRVITVRWNEISFEVN
ncbi:MAG: hypothetical protein L6V90_03685 [Treponema succinifaciens]|nr:MAG: hypothetical protein L6V90_03685 [Treponema succinifaciens]